ncbi:MAG: putative holin-like toxin, partial [Cetobacterium sp.]
KSWLVGSFFVIINRVEFMNGSLIGGGAYDYFVGNASQNMKGEDFLTVFQALSLMIAFATLMILVINTSNKK